MQLLLYGLPKPILSRWIIAETKPHLESWGDIGSGNGEVLKDITIINVLYLCILLSLFLQRYSFYA